VPEELVGAEVLDVDIDQLAAAATDGVAAHLLEVIREPQEGEGLAHVDGAPNRRVLAEVVPRRAHYLCARQDLECLQSHQDRRRHVPGQSQPVGEFVCRVRRRVHREIFSVRGIRHGKRSSAMSDFEEERKKIREVRFQSENMKSQP
jgi:hypothetical protein